jgi:hypothetical protein
VISIAVIGWIVGEYRREHKRFFGAVEIVGAVVSAWFVLGGFSSDPLANVVALAGATSLITHGFDNLAATREDV